jgi:hypothetical protein
MKNSLWHCLAFISIMSLAAKVQAQTHKRKHHTVHKPAAPIYYRPAGWSASRPAYTHAPILWEGYRYYTYHRYYAHPYLPAGARDTVPVKVGDEAYFYYSGKFYTPVQEQTGYQLVKAPAGAFVFDLPEGCTRVHAGDIVFLQYNGDYYLPVMIDKRPGYEVVNIEPSSPRW